jgi:hypothetical protein
VSPRPARGYNIQSRAMRSASSSAPRRPYEGSQHTEDAHEPRAADCSHLPYEHHDAGGAAPTAQHRRVLNSPTRGHNALIRHFPRRLRVSSSPLRGLQHEVVHCVRDHVRGFSSTLQGVTTSSGTARSASPSAYSSTLRGVTTWCPVTGRTPCPSPHRPSEGSQRDECGGFVQRARQSCPHRPSERSQQVLRIAGHLEPGGPHRPSEGSQRGEQALALGQFACRHRPSEGP